MKPKTFYVTTFCNYAHYVETGRPIGHECYILNVADLKAEQDGTIDFSKGMRRSTYTVIGRKAAK